MTKREVFPTTFPVLDIGNYELRNWREEDAEHYLIWMAEPEVLKNFGAPPLTKH